MKARETTAEENIVDVLPCCNVATDENQSSTAIKGYAFCPPNHNSQKLRCVADMKPASIPLLL